MRSLDELLAQRVKELELAHSEQLSEERQKKIISVLRGVQLDPLLKMPLFKYSCPVPLLLPEGSGSSEAKAKEKLIETFVGAFIESVKKVNNQLKIEATDSTTLFEWLFIFNKRLPKVILYPGYASGDMYGVGASMLLDDSLDLLILQDGAEGRKDQSGAVSRFISELFPSRNTLGSNSWPTVKKISGQNTGAKLSVRSNFPSISGLETLFPEDAKARAEWKTYLEALSARLWEFCLEKKQLHCAVDLFFGTRYIARQFGYKENVARARTTIRTGLKTEGPALSPQLESNISKYLKDKGLDFEGQFPKKKKIVVLWSRFTGKTGGAHVEYDTSFKGVEQLAQAAFSEGNDYVIIVGDKPKRPDSNLKTQFQFSKEKAKRRPEKYTDMQERLAKLNPKHQVIDLTGFWEEEEWKKCFTFQQVKRIDQFKLFEVLARTNKVKHLGARSGNLEALALLGYTVRYFEDEYPNDEGPFSNLDKKRMEPWHETVGYKRIQIGRVPTFSGQLMLADKKNQYLDWASYNKRQPFPDNMSTYKEVVEKFENPSKAKNEQPKVTSRVLKGIKPDLNRLQKELEKNTQKKLEQDKTPTQDELARQTATDIKDVRGFDEVSLNKIKQYFRER